MCQYLLDNNDPAQESSISEEVEAELRPASRGSSHTPLLPSKKVHHHTDSDHHNILMSFDH